MVFCPVPNRPVCVDSGIFSSAARIPDIASLMARQGATDRGLKRGLRPRNVGFRFENGEHERVECDD